MAHGIKVWDSGNSIELAEWPAQDCFKANDYLTADKMNTALRNATIGIKLLFDAIDTSNIKVDYKLTSDEYVSQVTAIKNALASASSGNSATTSTRGTIMLGYTPASDYQYALYTNSDGKAYVDLSRSEGVVKAIEQTVNAATSEKTANTIVKRDSNGAAKLDITGNASTAAKLSTARNIQINLASTSTASFDGSGNITPGVTGVLPVANGGTGQSSLDNVVVGKAKKIYTSAAIGAINKPVYINSDGTVQPCSYGLNTTVPSNAVFTDTTYSAGNGLSLSETTFSIDKSKVVTTSDEQTITGTKIFTNNINVKKTDPYLYLVNELGGSDYFGLHVYGTSSGNNTFGIYDVKNQKHMMTIDQATGNMTVNGNNVIHSGNLSDYTLPWDNITDKPAIYRHDLYLQIFQSDTAANVVFTIFNKSSSKITSLSGIYGYGDIPASGALYLSGYSYPGIVNKVHIPAVNNQILITYNINTVMSNKIGTTTKVVSRLLTSEYTINDTITSISL